MGGPKNDPRPVSDKAYQANCIKTLIAYLSMHGYDQPLSPKMLSNPMGKDVMHILQFLMHQVHPSFTCPSPLGLHIVQLTSCFLVHHYSQPPLWWRCEGACSCC